MRRVMASAALIAALSAPASAQFLTLDTAQAAHALQQINQYTEMIAHAKDQVAALQQALKTLPAGAFSATDATQRLTQVQQLLASAKASCSNYQNVAPNVCRVREQVAAAQGSTAMQDIADLQSVRNAAISNANSGSIVQATQANALGILALAKQFQDQAARDRAAEQALEYENGVKASVLGKATIHN
jgi:hypothetical protein